MKIKFLILLIVVLFTAVSCTFTEEIHLKNDGSGTYTFKMDMGTMMASLKDMNSKDSLKEAKVLDTIILFRDILEDNKDSISKLDADEKAMIEALEDLKLHMQVDEEKGIMLMDFGMDFNDISELKNMEEKIAKAQALSDQKKEDTGMPSKTNVVYSFDGNTFKRSVSLKDLPQEKIQEIDASMNESSSFFDESIYRLVYHFEKDIKEVTFKKAVISENKRTMTIEVPMDSVVKNPMWLDFEVKLKK